MHIRLKMKVTKYNHKHFYKIIYSKNDDDSGSSFIS